MKMKTIGAVLITAALAFSLGVLAGDVILKGHPNLQKAHHALNEADHWITESQKANEKIWSVEGSHGKRAKEAVAKAKHEMDLAAEWVNSHAQK
jgi:hypothetical protein